MVSNWIRVFMAVNAFIFQKTRGRMGNRMGRQSVLLLHTIGRKSGKNYITPLSYYRDGNSYLLVASNWGEEYNPNWFKNLFQQTTTTIQVGQATIQVTARQAEGEEYRRLWGLVTRKNDQYVKYQKDMARQIPIVILTPTISL